MPSNLSIATKYANDVITGRVPACIYTRLAAQRFLSDIDKGNELYYYEPVEVDIVIDFICKLDLTEQETRPAPKFIPEPWQIFIVANIYGILSKKTDRRKYAYGYIELARKNGKSQLVVALSIYHMLTDSDAQVIVSANSKNQAKNVDFKKAKQFAEQIDRKKKYLIPYYDSIKFGNNELIITASDPSKLDGLNASFCLIDELHEAPDNLMYNVMKSSQGARSEPLFISITTAGFDTESFCYTLRTYCIDVLNEKIRDDSQFVLIYTLDDDDEYTDPDTWIKANPNLGVSVHLNFLEKEVNKAVNSPSERSGVLVKNMNRWLKANSLKDWIPDQVVKQRMKDIKITDEIFKDRECIIGIDLASTSDITAVCYLFHIDGVNYFLMSYFIPEDSINTKANLISFREAAARGEITITPGNVTDYDYILNEINDIHPTHPVRAIHYDKYNSTQFIINATEAGYNCKPFSQMPGSLNRPLKEFERLMLQGENIIIEKNAITSWMISNVVLIVNKMGNYSIDKSSQSKKIDGVAAMINAFGGLLESPIYSFEVI